MARQLPHAVEPRTAEGWQPVTDLERRYAPRGTVEFRAASKSGSAGVLVGYALKYDTLSRNLGGFVETIAPGTFDKSLADAVDVLVRYNHDDNQLLGRTASGTARLTGDEVGVQYEVDLPDTTAGRDVAALAARGDVYQSSFAFYTHEDEWGQTDQGFPLRTLRSAQLVDVAPVNSPAYLDTSSGLRSLAEARGLPFDEVAHAAAENRLGELMTPAPVDDEVRVSAGGTDEEVPQVDNHGLIVVRQRLMQMRLRRDH